MKIRSVWRVAVKLQRWSEGDYFSRGGGQHGSIQPTAATQSSPSQSVGR